MQFFKSWLVSTHQLAAKNQEEEESKIDHILFFAYGEQMVFFTHKFKVLLSNLSKIQVNHASLKLVSELKYSPLFWKFVLFPQSPRSSLLHINLASDRNGILI